MSILRSFPVPFQRPCPRWWRVGCFALVLSQLCSCRDAQEQAVVELQRRGITPTAAALVEAVKKNDGLILTFLQTAGVKAAVPEPGQPSVLHLAAVLKDWGLVTRLLAVSSPEVINHPGPGREVILEQAVLANQFPLVKTLLAAGARPELTAQGADALALHLTAEPALANQLLDALPAGHADLSPALIRAITAGNAEGVKHLLERQAPATARSADGKATALELATRGGFLDIATQLIQAGARPADSPGALATAVERKDLPLARVLIDAGASPNAAPDPAKPEMTPLTAALASQQLDLTKLMLDHGADAAFCMDHALVHGDAALLDHLLEKGAPVDRPGADGDPPLVRAASAGNATLVRRLLEKGAPLEQTGAMGQTAYHMAVIHRKKEAVEALLAAGMKPDAPFLKPAPPALLPDFDSEYFVKWFKLDDNLTPLMLTAARGDTALVRLLLKSGAKRGTTTREWHRYPVVFACDTVNIPAAQLLLGRDPDEETEKRHAIVSLSRQRVTLFKNDKAVRSASVSTGKRSTPTPAGKYIITDKQADWVSTIYKVPMPFFMRLSCKEIGLHAGVVPGYPASHGCIRMPKGEVQAFYRILKIGDPVTIEP